MEINKKISELKNLSDAYAEKINFLSEIYVARWQGFSDIERALNELIEQHKLVEQRIEKLLQQASRLQYELSVYEDKMKETEEIMDNFRGKVF